MTKTAALDANVILVRPAGHVTQQWEVRLPVGIAYSHIFRRETWADIEKLMRQRGGGKRPARDDLIRCIGVGFDVVCLVTSVADGYALEFYSGKRPPALGQVLDDLNALQVGDAVELKARAETLQRRWQAMGATREDISAARKRFAQHNHPDTTSADGRKLALANSVLDVALANLPEAA